MKKELFKLILISLIILSQGKTKLYSQNASVLSKLDYRKEQLKPVEGYHKNNDSKKGLNALLKYYLKKKDIYKRVSRENISFLKKQYPEDIERSIRIANEVRNKYFLFREEWDMERTHIPYQFKTDINWSINPFGDPEWTWMLNRHKYWTHLGKAYFFTGKEKYAKTFVEQVTHWIDNNPLPSLEDKYNNTAAWRRIEAGIRCENWIKTFEFIKKSKHITPEFLEKFLNALLQHGNYINNTFSNFSKTSNWGVLEFHGLFNLSVFLEDFKIATTWQKDAIDKLATCIKLQVLKDGTQWEQSPMYHNEVFHCFMNVNLLSIRNNIKLPDVIIQKTKQMAYANIKWQKPNFHQPLLGDSDDTDLRGLLTLAATIFNDSVIKSRAFNNLDFETFLLTGKENLLKYKNLHSALPKFLSVYQQSSGDFYMRNSWAENATYSSFHIKKLGCGHGHDNLLHFTVFANGRDYLIDGGRYTYVDNKWRAFFKNNKSHNTLGVDNLTNSVYNGSWTNAFEADSEGDFTKSTNEFDYAEATNISYKRLEDPVYIKRRLLYLKPNVWLIFDSFSANKKHKYAQYFNFPNDKIEIKNNGLSTSYLDNNLRIQPINKVEIKITDSWWSPEYNLKLPNKRAEIFKDAKGFSSFISLLYFPEKTKIEYKKVPVYSRKNILLSNDIVEAVELEIEKIKYTLLVVYNTSSPANPFYIVNNQLVKGKVVLVKTKEGISEITVLKQ